MSNSAVTPGKNDELMGELESMLQDQVELSPEDITARLRLARLHAQMNRSDDFLADAHRIYRLVKGELKHPALVQVKHLAKGLGVDIGLIGKPSKSAGPTRRLGEDPSANAYFERVNQQYKELSSKSEFLQEHNRMLLRNFNRPSSLMHVKRWSEQLGGAQIAIKREDMMGGGSKLLMAVVGQVVMAKHLGYSTVVTGSSSPRLGVIMASMAARMGLKATVFIDENIASQSSSSVLHMRCVGARIETLGRHDSARDAAVDDCVNKSGRHFLILGVDAAPAPFPELNQLLISALGRETRAMAQSMFKRMPDMLVTRGKKAADALGFFDPYLKIDNVRLVAIEAQDSLKDENNASSGSVRPHLALSDEQAFQADAILEGSEYPAVNREHSNFEKSGRVEYKQGSSADAMSAIKSLARYEGLIVPIRTAYPLGWAGREARRMNPDQLIIINMVEPFDKDLREVARALGHSDY